MASASGTLLWHPALTSCYDILLRQAEGLRMERPPRQYNLGAGHFGASLFLLCLECAPFNSSSLEALLLFLQQRFVLAQSLPALSVPSSRFLQRVPFRYRTNRRPPASVRVRLFLVRVRVRNGGEGQE